MGSSANLGLGRVRVPAHAFNSQSELHSSEIKRHLYPLFIQKQNEYKKTLSYPGLWGNHPVETLLPCANIQNVGEGWAEEEGRGREKEKKTVGPKGLPSVAALQLIISFLLSES